jgi:hypothetical protein
LQVLLLFLVGLHILLLSIPVLPESIARALSKAYGGRAVYWTCVGAFQILLLLLFFEIVMFMEAEQANFYLLFVS